MTNIDLLADSQDRPGESIPNSPALQTVSVLVGEWDRHKGDIKRLEERLAQIKARVTQIEQESLPGAMIEAGVMSFVTPSGRSVKVEQVCRGNIPAQTTVEKAKGEERTFLQMRRDDCLSVVRSKWPGLIKTEVSVSLGKGESGVATRIAELIRNQFSLEPSVDETIHPASLNAHFNELREAGKLEEIPVEPFALYVGPIAKIK